MDSKVFTIDIDEIVRGKAGAKARFVPRFVLSWLKRIIHQDEVNEFILGEGDKQGMPWLDDCMEYLGTKLNVKGLENLPDDSDGRLFTFVSNHPLGGPDGVALGHLLGHRYDGRIKYLVNDLLMNLHGLAPFFVPINKTGKQSRDFPRLVEAAFGSPSHIIMFPAGLCSRRIGAKDIHHEERGDAARHRAHPLRRAQLGFLLPHRERRQAVGTEIQHRHALSRGRTLQEPRQDV